MQVSWKRRISGFLCASIVVLAGVAVADAQLLGGGMVGGSDQACGGNQSRPALFDTDGVPGPSVNDTPAYFDSARGGVDRDLTVNVYPISSSDLTPNQITLVAATRQIFTSVIFGSNNAVFDGALNPDNELVGGIFSQAGETYELSLTSSGRAGVFDGLDVSGPITTNAGLEGWDLDGRDGTAEYIGINWAGVGGGFQFDAYNQDGPGPDIDDSMMLWVPVIPIGGRVGEVAIGIDMDCDGVQDANLPNSPTLMPTIVPVELQSFTIASLLPTEPIGVLLYLLAGGVLLLVHRLRERLPNLNV